MQGTTAYFGTYTVDEAAKTVTHHLESCSFPNWRGIQRTSTFSISGDDLDIMTSSSSTGAVQPTGLEARQVI